MYLTSDTAELRVATAPHAESASAGSWLIRRVIRHVAIGQLTIVLPSGERIEHAGARPGPHGIVELRRGRALARMLTRGDVGFAEAYVDGDWTSPDLTALIALAAHNAARLDPIFEGLPAVRLWRRLGHALKRNSAAGSRRNIAFHYDLGNDFYRLWLDESMTYSSALRVAPGQSLEAAQAEKLRHIVDRLDAKPGDSVLEIGCGWGALAAAIGARGADVVGLTLSREQLAFARDRIARQGLGDRVDLRLQDYRDTSERFDRIVSIEMLEAVGEAYWPVYFERLAAALKPGGRILLQAITIRDDRFEAYRRSPDFIQRYVFPGGMLPTPAILRDQAARAGLRVTASETFGAGYAETLAEWRRRFDAAWEAVAALGFPASFKRLWDYYLSYCEAGFLSGTIDVGLYTLEHRA